MHVTLILPHNLEEFFFRPLTHDCNYSTIHSSQRLKIQLDNVQKLYVYLKFHRNYTFLQLSHFNTECTYLQKSVT